MSYDFENGTPIYLQIIEKIKADIISKKYLPNEKLPSVREFSMELKVNPNTVQRALFMLEEEGLIVTEGTTGKFVTEDGEKIEKSKREAQEQTLKAWLDRIHSLGITNDEIIEFIERGKLE